MWYVYDEVRLCVINILCITKQKVLCHFHVLYSQYMQHYTKKSTNSLIHKRKKPTIEFPLLAFPSVQNALLQKKKMLICKEYQRYGICTYIRVLYTHIYTIVRQNIKAMKLSRMCYAIEWLQCCILFLQIEFWFVSQKSYTRYITDRIQKSYTGTYMEYNT